MQNALNRLNLPYLMRGSAFYGLSRLLFSPRHRIILKIITAFALIYALIMLADNEVIKVLTIDYERNLDFELYCQWSDNILINSHGRYKISLCYNSVVLRHERPQRPLIQESKIRKNGTNRLLNFQQLAEIPDGEWLKNFDRSVYNLYPQPNVEENVRRILQGLPLYEAPIYNPLVKFLKIPSHTCAPLTIEQVRNTTGLQGIHDVVIVYKSGVYNLDSRETLRKLYSRSNSTLRISLVFTVGLPRVSGGNFFIRDGFNVTLNGRAGKKMREYAKNPDATKAALEKEMLEHKDLLVGDYEDSYYNLTTKLFFTFQWVARFCRPYKPILIFIDDDYAVEIRQLEKFLRVRTPKQRDDLRHGFYLVYNPVHRKTSRHPQWAFSTLEVPWTFHSRQHLGIYSMWSYRFVHDMALAMHFTKPLVIDDTWLAMVQLKMHINFSNLPGMYVRLGKSNTVPCSSIFFAQVEELIRRNCSM